MLLSAGEFCDATIKRLVHSDAFKCRTSKPLRYFGGLLKPVSRPNHAVLTNGKMRKEVELLEHQTNACAMRAQRSLVVSRKPHGAIWNSDRRASKLNTTCVHRLESREDRKQCALSAPICSDDCDDFTLINRE
jgi:hypothetical protein